MDQVQNLSDRGLELLLLYGPKVVYAILTLLVGLWVVRLVSKMIQGVMKARSVDDSLRTFLGSCLEITLKVLVVVSVAGMIGIEMTSFIAVLGAAGLAVGMALSGTLQNFAGGVMIILFKPYRVGDYIEGGGHAGTVDEVQIFNTVLKTPDNKRIIVPNAQLANNSLINYSAEATRRVEWVFGIGYGDSIDQAREIILGILSADNRILNDPEPMVVVSALADSSVNLTTRVWVKTEDYWSVFFETTELVKKAFDREGVSIPFPQRDIHLHGGALQ